MPQSVTYATHSAPEPAKVSLKSVPAIFGLTPNPQTQTADESSPLSASAWLWPTPSDL